MYWIILFIAGIFEIIWSVALKMSNSFTKPLSSVVAIVGTIISVILLSIAIKKLPIGTAYAVWTGIGIIGTTICGIFIFKEPISILQMLFLLMILCGIVGINIVS